MAIDLEPRTPAATDEPVEADESWLRAVTVAAVIGFSVAWVGVLVLSGDGEIGRSGFADFVDLVRAYAVNMWHGQVPYRDFDFEYPPVALVPIVLPAVLAGNPFVEDSYRQMFQLVEAVFGMLLAILVMWSVAALARSRRDVLVAVALVVVSPLAFGPLLLSRYDLWPALLAAAGVWLLVCGRVRWSGAMLGLGILAKVYPLVIVPFALAWLWRRGSRREAVELGATVAVVVALALLPFFVVAPEGIVDALTRAFRRPLQVESLGAAVLFARQVLTGQRVDSIHTFDSYNLRGPDAELVGLLQNLALGLVVLSMFWRFWRGSPTADRLVIAIAGALLAYVAFGRVFSPQYLIWLVAPVAILANRRWPVAQVLLVVAIALTAWFYPEHYSDYLDRAEPLWVAVVLGRNVVLVVITGYVLARLWPRDVPEAAPTAIA